MAQPDREVRGLRNDVREACAALLAALEHVGEEAEGTYSALGSVNAHLDVLHEDLGPAQGVPVQLVGQTSPLESNGTVEVSNPTDVAGVQAAVRDNSETFVSNSWAIFGLVVGFGVLAVFWKLVRP